MAKGPGKSFRRGISLIELFEMFPDDASAERWWVEARWPTGVACPSCGSLNVQHRQTRKPQPYRCRDCRNDFSAKTGSLMHGSPIGFRKWVIAIYILTTGIKGTASMKLHRDLKVSQKTAWYLAHRIRESWTDNAGKFSGPVEADEAYFGGREKNKHSNKKRHENWMAGKTIVAGVKDRETGKIRAGVVEATDAATLTGVVMDAAKPDAMVYTDEAGGYRGLPHHESVNHSVGRYVDGQAHCNGMESFWSLMKRGYHGTYHRMSPEHLPRYIAEFSGRFNDRPRNTIDQMTAMVRGADGKRLRYADLIENGERAIRIVRGWTPPSRTCRHWTPPRNTEIR